jgi:membrane protease YdiL (CAAX protease family)
VNKHLLNSAPKHKSLWTFLVLVLILSIPIWLIDPVADQFMPEERPISVPISALMMVCPITAALILVKRESGWDGVKKLLQRSLDVRRIKRKTWYVPILFLMPAIMVLQNGLMSPKQVPIAEPQFPVIMALVFGAVFLIAAVGEEVGWQGYAIDPLLDRWSALTASVVLGTVWATWHIVPLIQLGRTPTQIVWQCMDMVATRILIVWLYNNTGRSVFAAVLYHAMYNVSTLLLPNYGLVYDPTITSTLVMIAAATVIFLWGPNTLARYRYARLGQDVRARATDA